MFVLLLGRETIVVDTRHECLQEKTGMARDNDVILLSIADEGRVDLDSIIVPISYMRRETYYSTIVLFIEHSLYTNNTKFFNKMKEKLRINIEKFNKPKIHIANYRIKLYYEYLKSHTFNRVIHCDVSDIYFQSDVFKYIPENGKLVMFKEGCNSIMLLSDQKNLQWYKECYPNLDGLDSTKEIINAGIVLGGYDQMLKYMEIIWNLLETNKKCDISTFGPDQAVVEYAYHNGLLKQLIGKVESGPVYCNTHQFKYKGGNYLSYGVMYDNYDCVVPFIHGRPPYYPQKRIDFEISLYRENKA
ncbi:hypothetical protein EHI8A_101070 [Entamoeba histolytica HM-1:IMSS-B]|uniref:Glycosyltransferase n=6 Tax=Entamoeba histolytica TaxID=5759 RepID=C4LZF6_ENTH1|nr:hypothetical protein EHI_137950 [Entamoeba histolytica HM-1:IMSS]EMD45990.1 Hypothetical protein EHI5A_134460 [Entamoeba histolytica KU27]EMH77642.1 hypothetical protein EHI8A_101070 [Entamoeba histolytica HM-1:IMSS-B]EMS16051.1 hypothetical protein KM1_115870 [Entamoeba histolytica HM-3:IMSS]ENY60377.1 hypothetical protein EHI7A_096880 [Entamoeba histolytica HM-1:IMSS-A]GAT94245.1 hypothetical protein CL6EHI_137950 [Entamoeba histolytica]|eukprot:XP_653846.1 hypothetical protein EHI_137950 [Entamoeba histolytica HM-1:IMSS]